MSARIKIIRKLKQYLFSVGIHHIIPGRSMSFLANLSSLSRWIASHKNSGYSDFPTRNFNYNRRYDLYKYVSDKEIAGEDIDYLEFGVSVGTSFRWWISNIKNEKSRFYGFDTFTGLPEDWGPFKKGAMSGGNEVPKIEDNRHQFFQGLFQKTLNDFLKTYKGGRKKIILLDADLYSSTLFVLTTISPWLQRGDIIIFDEFNVPMHEYKAFREWSDSFYIKYTVLGEVNNFYQVAIRLE